MIKRTSFGLGRGVKRAARGSIRLKVKRKHLKRRKTTKADFYRSWGMNPYTYIRYSGLKGVYWHYFSKMIRERDYRQEGGLCMTCEKYVEKGQDQCGHFFPAANCGFLLLFEPLNNHLQHASCNNPRFTPQAGIYNSRTLTKRYGPDIIDILETIKKTPNQKEWNKAEYERRIKELPTYIAANLPLSTENIQKAIDSIRASGTMDT